MGFLLDFLALPAMGPSKLVYWLARTLAEEAERQSLDEGSIRSELMELQQRFDAGEIGEEEYDQQEKILLERLKAIRQLKAQHSQQG